MKSSLLENEWLDLDFFENETECQTKKYFKKVVN